MAETYRIYIWSSETGAVKKKLDYVRMEMAKARAIEHSQAPGVREVAVCTVEDGRPGPRVGVAAGGEWADGSVAPTIAQHRKNPALTTMKASRRRKAS